MFGSMTVAKKLALGFGALLAIGVGIVAYAAWTLNGINASIKELTSHRMVQVQQFSQIKDNVQSTARYARNIVINNEPQFVAGERKKIADLTASNTELLKKLDQSLRSPQARDLLKQLHEARGPYLKAINTALEMAEKGQQAEAGKYLVDVVRPVQNVYFKTIDDSVTLQRAMADGQALSASETAHSSVVMMSTLAAGMALVGAAVGWLVTRDLRRALGAEPAALSTAASRVADGDLSQPLDVRAGDSGSVLANLARMQTQLARVVASVRQNSESVATASAEIAQGNEDLSQRTEQQASALEETAATMEELSTTVRNNADSAKQANQLALGASRVAQQGGEVVGQVVTSMESINQSSSRIGDIIGVIDGIAFQTNILALNAAVEAARAGEQGRGFAVVATEVRSLAQRSAEAAKEIKELIGQSSAQVEQGSALVGQAGKTMGEIVNAIQRVSDIVAEISASSGEQSNGIQQVGEAVSQMDQVTQQNAALVEESAAAAASLKGQAQQLVEAVSVFKLAPAGASGHHAGMAAAPARTAPAVAAPKPVRAAAKSQPAAARAAKPFAPARPALASATAGASADNWETF